jgi:exonuclease VII small subunit
MNKREIEEIIEELENSYYEVSMSIPEFIRELKKVYNLGLQDAADNVEIVLYCDIPETEYIDKESILKLKL